MEPGRMVRASFFGEENSGHEPAESNNPHRRTAPGLTPRPALWSIERVIRRRSARRAWVLAALLSIAGLAAPAGAQIPGMTIAPKAPASPAPSEEIAYDSPRASLLEFATLCDTARWDQASRFLDLPLGATSRDAQRLAQRLKAVLDFNIPDLAKVSASSSGQLDDGLPPDVEEIGVVWTHPGERPEPIRMVRREWKGRFVWVVSAKTVLRIDHWYESLPDHALRQRLPARFFQPGPLGVLWWQWIALLLVVPLVVVLGRVLGWGTRRLLLRLARRTTTPWDEIFVRRLKGPIALGWGILLLYLSLHLLRLNAAGFLLVLRWIQAAAAIWFFWILVKGVRLASDVAAASDWARTNPNAPSVLTFGVKAGEVLVVVIGVLASLAAFGVNVASVLAGLGIGGIAVALAGQKTVENLFGSVSIAVDQPLKVGDFVKIGDVTGTVEVIGLRSTRIRTLDRTVVTIPNGMLADREIETFATRDRWRFSTTVGVDYATRAPAMKEILAGFERTLREHPKIWPDDVRVSLASFGDSALNIEVVAWFQTLDFAEFRAIRQEVLLAFLGVVEGAGSSIAFPSRTVYLARGSEPVAPVTLHVAQNQGGN